MTTETNEYEEQAWMAPNGYPTDVLEVIFEELKPRRRADACHVHAIWVREMRARAERYADDDRKPDIVAWHCASQEARDAAADVLAAIMVSRERDEAATRDTARANGDR